MDGSGPGGGGAEEAVEPRLPAATYVDPVGQMAFLRRHYLSAEAGFVREGGAKIKLVTGDAGAGKTRFLAALLGAARDEGFITAYVDARKQPLGGFDALYRALAAEVDLPGIARRFVSSLLADLGYGGPAPRPGQTVEDWAASRGFDTPPLRRAIGEGLHRRLLANPNIDYGYALGWLRWSEAILWDGWRGDAPERDGAAIGDGAGSAAADDAIVRWLRGERLEARLCNRLRVRRPLQRAAARLWLRSLLHVVRMSGSPGLVAGLDGLDALLEARRGRPPRAAAQDDGGTAPPGAVRYSKQRRDDFYECLRALIDDMSLTPGLLVVCAGPPGLVRGDRHRDTGVQSYPALAQRLQNEVETVELNRFADEIALERLWTGDAGARQALAERVVGALAPTAAPAERTRAVGLASAQWAAREAGRGTARGVVVAALAATRGDGPRAGEPEGDGFA